MADRIKILKNVYKKLDGLPLGFGLPAYSEDIPDATIEAALGIDLDDTMREIRAKINDIETDSYDELNIECRTIYYALCRYRLSASIFFKFSMRRSPHRVAGARAVRHRRQGHHIIFFWYCIE
jgi:hypothetical protein